MKKPDFTDALRAAAAQVEAERESLLEGVQERGVSPSDCELEALGLSLRTPDEAAQVREALQPFDAALIDRMTVAALQQLRPATSTTRALKAKDTPRSRRPRLLLFVGMPVLAAAAAAAYVIVAPAPTGALPAYALELSAGDQSVRGTRPLPGVGPGLGQRGGTLDPSPRAALAPRLSPGSQLTLVARPATAVRGSLNAQVFLRASSGLRPWPGQVRVTDKGVVRILLTVDTSMSAGPYDVIVAIAHSEAALTPDEIARRLAASRAANDEPLLLSTSIEVTTE